jgi:hypothetical protein
VDQTACVTGEATFTVTATGSDLTYAWLHNNSFISDGIYYSGAATSSFTIQNILAEFYDDTFAVEVRGATGCASVISTNAKLTLNETRIDIQPAIVPTFCEGGNATYSVTASGSELAYQWQVRPPNSGTFTNIANEGVYSGATTPTLTVTGAPFTMNNSTFRCAVSGTCPSVTSTDVLLTVHQTPGKPDIIVNTSNAEAPILTSSIGTGWKWFKGGTQISESSVITVTSEGSYTVMVKVNGCESPMSDPKIIIVTGTANSENGTVLYPNPAIGSLVISLADFETDAVVGIRLTDLAGRTIEETIGMGGGRKEIDVSQFSSGRYLVSLSDGRRKLVTQFIKTNQ